jgi:hypothetical protein
VRKLAVWAYTCLPPPPRATSATGSSPKVVLSRSSALGR